ncbi:hypothetical protein PGT21_029131 [Puccinia graminis f. sp. tritici]|uniref:Uncharacterized protein n=1 Tax=Puccinia graminis f. sp. tritici TaxID=56615 RepID=A0A5B0R293_PUCGR|nr:hypothetical protein PGT21_029131 [Puccinia graminis f. sp. tritici]
MLLRPGALAFLGSLLVLIIETPGQCSGTKLWKRLRLVEIESGPLTSEPKGPSGRLHGTNSKSSMRQDCPRSSSNSNCPKNSESNLKNIHLGKGETRIPSRNSPVLTPEELQKEKEFGLKALKIVSLRQYGIKGEKVDEIWPWFEKSNQGWIQDGKLALPPIQIKMVLNWLVKNVKIHSFLRSILSGNPVDKFQKEFMREFQYLKLEQVLSETHPELSKTQFGYFKIFVLNKFLKNKKNPSEVDWEGWTKAKWTNPMVDEYYKEWNSSRKPISFHIASFWENLWSRVRDIWKVLLKPFHRKPN